MLVELAGENSQFAADAVPAMQAFAEQAGIALEQARLFAQLGERNDEIAQQKDELGRRTEVIRDLVYALAHDLRTPLVAADVTMKQALAGAYGELPARYAEILRATLAANEDERRIVESLLLIARYEAGEESNLREPIALAPLLTERRRGVAPGGREQERAPARTDAAAADLPIVGDPYEIRRAVDQFDRERHCGDARRWNHSRARRAARRQGDGRDRRRRVRRPLRVAAGVVHAIRQSAFREAEAGLGSTSCAASSRSTAGRSHSRRVDPRGSTFTMTLPSA